MVGICSWPCMTGGTDPPSQVVSHDRSFAQVMQNSCDILVSQLPVPSIKGDDLCIKITHYKYKKSLDGCKRNLHGWLMLNGGDKPVTTRDLKAKLTAIQKPTCLRHMVSLGGGFYEFQFTSYEDMHLAWSMGTINLKPGILWLSKWTNDFNIHSPRQTRAQTRDIILCFVHIVLLLGMISLLVGGSIRPR
jgi:hypothetical protein